MFALTKHVARIERLNLRSEIHGDAEVSMIDITLKADIDNTILDGFGSGTLRHALFDDGAQQDMHGHLKHLRNPGVGSVQWLGEFAPASLQLHTGAKSGKDDVIFTGANTKVGRITFEAKEGGTCSFAWRVKVCPNEAEAARLFSLLHHEVRISQDLSHAENIDGHADDS
jgi:hypothetical protein